MMQIKNLKLYCLVAASLLSSFIARSQTYSVDLNLTPDQMVQNLVGDGVTITNVVVTACDSTYGYYNSVNTEIGTSNGLLLTTGKALFSIGPNNTIGNCSTSAGTCDYFDNDCPGSALLDAAQDRVTRDATMVEFDIVPKGDSLSFRYTFASEEYNEWVNSPFNDVFGFYISGPGIVGDTNIARVPTTGQVVAINTVNALSNAAFFYNNQSPLGQFIQYDGFTRDLIAAIGGLTPCETYHMKLVIADGTDHVYDSGVFINAIESNPVVVLTATSNGLDYMVEGCNTGTITFSREEITSESQDILFWVGGTAENGVDFTPQIGSGIPLDQNVITIPAFSQTVSFDINAAFDAVPEGQEYLTIYLANPLCQGAQLLDSVNFFIYDFLDVEITPETSDICFGQCVDLIGTSNVADIATFEWTGDVSNPASLEVEVCPDATTTYSLTVTVGSCEATAEATVNVSSIDVELIGADINCEGGTTGSIEVNVIGAIEPYEYAWTGPDGYTSTSENPTDLAPGEYCVTVTDAAGCIASGCITLVQVNELTATAELSDFNCSNISCYGLCDGSIDITLDGGVFPYTYEWSGPNDFEWFFMDAQNLCVGTYTFTVTDAVGCQYTNTYILQQPDSVELSVVGTVDLLCTGVETGEASVIANGGCSPYTYSWSHDAGVTGPVATELGSGTYDVSVEDQNGCANDGTVTIVINDPIDPLNVTIDEISIYPGGFSVSCPGAEDGFINITNAGGTEPYSVEWFSMTDNAVFSVNEDLADAPCGEYVLTVTDGNGCVYTQSLQLTCVPAITVEYTSEQNPCGNPDVNQGSITITNIAGGQGDPYTVEWNGPSCTPCLTEDISGLNSGDYVLTVFDAQGCSTTITVNIGQNDAFTATGVVTDPTCAGNCNGSIDVTVEGNDAPTPFIIDANTEISICFSGTHSWVSDLAFHLVGPPNCGSPDILLSPNPGAVGQPGTCNSGNDISNLCFSTESTNNLDVCAGAPFTLTGTFGSFSNAATPIDWSALNGCNVAEPGWAVQIYDCIGGDFGALTDATMTFDGVNTLGDPTTVVYSTPPGFNSAINDNTCSPATASVFLVDQGSIGGGDPDDYSYVWSGPSFSATTQDVSGLCPGDYTVVISNGDCEQTLSFTLADPVSFQIELVEIINPICFGQNNGSIDIDVVGGSGDYSYSWVPSPSCFFFGTNTQDVSGLFECASYTVLVTDNVTGCLATATYELIAPQVMDIVVVTSEYQGGFNISCNGANDGQISVFVTGGSPDCDLYSPECYLYDWISAECGTIDPTDYGNPEGSSQCLNCPAGTYGVNVTDSNGCLATTCLDLLEPSAIESPAIIENIDCNSTTGCITPNLLGGSGSYVVYEWTGDIGTNSPDAATLCNLAADSYTLTVTDSNNCQDTFEYVIEETPALIANISSQTDASCNGACDGEITEIVTGGTGMMTCTLNGIPLDPPFLLGGEPVVITLDSLCAGTYVMEHEDENGCTASVTFTIAEPDSIQIDLVSIVQEATQIFDIQCAGDSTGAIDATVSGGTSPYTFEWTDEALNIISIEEDIDSLPAGTYCLSVIDFNGCSTQECYTITEPEEALQATAELSIFNDEFNISCFGANDGSIDVTVIGGVAPYTFDWNGNGAIDGQEDQTGLGAGEYDVLIIDANFCTYYMEFVLTQPEAIIVDATISLFESGFNISCNGVCDGSISINISGGSPAYTIAWAGPNGFSSSSTELTNLCAGDYFLTVTDENGCSISQTYTLAQPEILSGSISQAYNCADGSYELCVQASGGSGNYSYLWSDGSTTSCITVLVDGEYCVTITDGSGCTTQVCVTVDTQSPLTIEATSNNSICGLCNGSIDITIAGGLPAYTISWSNGPSSEDLTNLCAGIYTVTVTDQLGCTQTLSLEIFDTPGVQIQTTQSNVSCFGDASGTATVIITGGTPEITIEWYDENENIIGTTSTITQLPTGFYGVHVEDGAGCTADGQVTIAQPSPLQLEAEVSIVGDFNISLPNGSDGIIELTITGGVPEYTYDWTPDVAATDENFADGLSAGDYTIIITDANQCRIDTVITLTAPRDIKLYTALSPNGDGFNDVYVIDGVINCGNNQFKVFNRWGNLVFERTNYKNDWFGQSDDGGILADGTYFVIFEGCDEEISTYVDLRRE
jgi:gliding motility-associated-like protein